MRNDWYLKVSIVGILEPETLTFSTDFGVFLRSGGSGEKPFCLIKSANIEEGAFFTKQYVEFRSKM